MKTARRVVRYMGRLPYEPVWQAMQDFTDQRDDEQMDEIWMLEHDSVFTQGRAGRQEHLVAFKNDIPLVHSDRGGQVTYHGPGQLIAYPLIDLKRAGFGVRDFVTAIEQSVIRLLSFYGLEAETKASAPGVYINGQKVASLGLRVRRGYSFHGVAINFDVDLSPFEQINPCGFPGLSMIKVTDCLPEHERPSFRNFRQKYAIILAQSLGWSEDTLSYQSEIPAQMYPTSENYDA